jgi:hypothetical protein
MALKITKATDPIRVDRLNMVLYAPPGLGKTTLAFTAAKPLLLDFDRGAYRASGRKDSVTINAWEDVAGISAEDFAPYSTVIIDTAGRALDALGQDVIRGNSKLGRGGALTLQGYGELKARFIAFLKLLNGFGKDVVLIAHMDEQRNGDEVIERLDVQGGSKGEIYKAADAMGRIAIRDGKRVLNFSPTDAAFGKNPAQLDPLPIPHHQSPEFADFLAGVIQTTKDKLNALTEAQMEAQAKLEKWRLAVTDVEDADGVNNLIPKAKEGGTAYSSLLHDRATKLGLSFDKKAGKYEAQKAA